MLEDLYNVIDLEEGAQNKLPIVEHEFRALAFPEINPYINMIW